MFAEDLSVYFDATSGFALNATIGSATVPVIFDNDSSIGSVGIGIADSTPSIQMATAQVPSDPVGLSVVVNGANYRIAEHAPDGTGVSRLLLEVAA
ncbi:hypothetical protein MCEMIEM13_01525 [Comamonadaceae bacterium]